MSHAWPASMDPTLALHSHRFRSYDFSHLSVGDLVEARQGHKVHHRGPVDEALPALGLFWIRDTITSSRLLVDFDSFEIFIGRRSEKEGTHHDASY